MVEANDLMLDDGDDLVNVAVPRRFYPLVSQYIGKLWSAEGGAEAVPRLERSPEDNYRGWTRDDVRRLKQETDNATVLALFELASENDGAPVGIGALERATKKTNGQVRGDLIRLSSFAKKALGLMDSWPFSPENGADGRAQYRVPKNVRRWWNEA